jgi:hypothetical protein
MKRILDYTPKSGEQRIEFSLKGPWDIGAGAEGNLAKNDGY